MITKQQEIKKYGRVGVLTGGVSAERESSVRSGKSVTDSLVRSGCDVLSIDIHERFFEQMATYGLGREVIVFHGIAGIWGLRRGRM